jgi:two-component system, cell cycle response regulator DivK
MDSVLIVEDNPLNRKLAQVILRCAGYEVFEATNAEDGLALARVHQPGVILMDLHLPGPDGIAAVEALRADPALRGAKVLAFTASLREVDRDRILAAEFDGCVPKPFEMQELLDAVGACFHAARSAAGA